MIILQTHGICVKYSNEKFNFAAIRCPALRVPSYGRIYPADCSAQKQPFGKQCAFACNQGFQLQGPSLR
jgi:Sushi repeat (SCR repeat)